MLKTVDSADEVTKSSTKKHQSSHLNSISENTFDDIIFKSCLLSFVRTENTIQLSRNYPEIKTTPMALTEYTNTPGHSHKQQQQKRNTFFIAISLLIIC